MLPVIGCLLLVLLFLALYGVVVWRAAAKHGARQAYAKCQKMMREEQAAQMEEAQRIRDTATQEIQALSRERDQLKQELGRMRMQAAGGAAKR